MQEEQKEQLQSEEEMNESGVEAVEEHAESNEEHAKGPEGDSEDQAKKIEELEAKLQEYENRYLRLLADFDNFRRRVKLDKEADKKYRAQHLITNLLPALDNFERAMQIEPDNEQTRALLDGVNMVYKSIIEALKSEGAEQIEAVGKEFDPNLHQAVMQTEDDEAGENIVVEEFQKGYMLKDRVIRPAMVKVSK
ncbi:molecular chaperone GrpE [Bacillus thermophilus]|uniref:Protein GrpE n=1 Tax=Siminovitchia thermophila TaxID=1245522 RepID=A0ABS2R9J9_9BACI|nr:nucleotide exchange factor GrpE [Siminovitchia thermophila]MBM7716320.1 molecular chaperone GrpE [Siminovitchia thermophila]